MTVPTTFATFTAGLAALNVTGVTRRFTQPPASIGGADLPAMWPGLPRAEERPITFDGGGGWPALFCDLIIAVEAVGQNTQSANYTNTITAMDNLMSALRGASIGRAKLSWTINANVQVQVGDTNFWAVVATVEGR